MSKAPKENATEYCGRQMKGRDGKMWTAAMQSNGNCRWSRRGQTMAEAMGRGMWIDGPNPDDEMRWLAADAKLPTYLANKRKSKRGSSKRKSASKPKRSSKPKRKSVSKPRRSRSASPCPRGKKVIHRKAYTRADGIHVKATSYCIKK